MPVYEYRRADGGRFDVFQRFEDDPLTTCPTTGQPVERVLFAPVIHYKGTGWGGSQKGRYAGREGKPKASS